VIFPEPSNWQLLVERVEDATPRMRRIVFSSPDLARFTCLPGQDVSLGFVGADGTAVRRRYSIRAFDAGSRTLEIDVVMHGDGPGMRWARSAETGMASDAIGPRGKITLAGDASWHLFAGDATAVPAAFNMIEALPGSATAAGLFQVDDSSERQSLHGTRTQPSIEWRYGDASELVGALQKAELPSAGRHAYLAGEVGLVSALKNALLDRGWRTEEISAKAYWNRGRANAGHGEPEQKVA
jgi:NADPH-dependent ferric siderophore reductase